MKTEWKKYLNEPQFDAVSNTDGPMLVIAGAGSGKTRVLTFRVAYLIQEKSIQPERIMAITFTNKAAEEMRERIIDLVGKRRYHPWVGTFHRTCADILRNYGPSAGLPANFTVFDDSEQVVMMKRVMKALEIDTKRYTPRMYLSRISQAKSHLVTPEEFAETASSYFEKSVAEIYKLYQEMLKNQNAYDFDDLITETCFLLENHKPTRELLREHYQYVHVDEFQDINESQYQFIKLITNSQNKNVFVVGDDDQAIYGWRYADPMFIDKFLKDFAPVTIVKLEDNYRSTQPILKVANEIIRQKSWGIMKVLRHNVDGEELPNFFQGQSQTDEAYNIAQVIRDHVDNGGAYSDIGVLYRTNALSRSFEEVFGRLGMPFQIIGGLRFYQRMEIKDILAYFRVLVNDKDLPSLDRAINTPKRGIGDKSKDMILKFMSDNNLGLFDLTEMTDRTLAQNVSVPIQKKLKSFLQLMVAFRTQSKSKTLTSLLEWLIDETKYEELLRIEDSVESQARVDNLYELRNAFIQFEEDYPGEGLERYLEQVSLKADVDSYKRESDKITLMTLHSAKGLEFKIVFLPGLEEGLLPHSRSQDSPDELDEERRLLYVGITRAKNQLFLSCARSRRYQGQSAMQTPSRFLDEIPRDLIRGLSVLDLSYRTQMLETEPVRWSKKRVEHDPYIDYDSMPSDSEVIETRVSSRKAKPEKSKPSVYNAGNHVSHPTFGDGQIIKITPSGGDNFLIIQFGGETGVKILSEEHAPLKVID